MREHRDPIGRCCPRCREGGTELLRLAASGIEQHRGGHDGPVQTQTRGAGTRPGGGQCPRECLCPHIAQPDHTIRHIGMPQRSQGIGGEVRVAQQQHAASDLLFIHLGRDGAQSFFRARTSGDRPPIHHPCAETLQHLVELIGQGSGCGVVRQHDRNQPLAQHVPYIVREKAHLLVGRRRDGEERLTGRRQRRGETERGKAGLFQCRANALRRSVAEGTDHADDLGIVDRPRRRFWIGLIDDGQAHGMADVGAADLPQCLAHTRFHRRTDRRPIAADRRDQGDADRCPVRFVQHEAIR